MGYLPDFRKGIVPCKTPEEKPALLTLLGEAALPLGQLRDFIEKKQ
jgi:hypothetical protein